MRHAGDMVSNVRLDYTDIERDLTKIEWVYVQTFIVGLKLIRFINISHTKDVQLVWFSNTSQKGHVVSVYLHVVNAKDKVQVYFVTCKTKVAPLKSL